MNPQNSSWPGEVRALPEAEMRARKKAELTALLIEGIESGPAQSMTQEWWDSLLDEVNDDLAKRKA